MNIKDIKKYVLLKDGSIKNSYFNMHSKEHRQLRNFVKIDGVLHLDYTEYKEEGAVACRQRVIATADRIEDLTNTKKSTEVKK